ncbi:magnesium transporter CorA family protein [Enterococcus sp. UD-01]|jgi:Mg2+ and Co2+ transporter CorA|uniref:magnesium transporter CorA family protein n=1 Tax=Enterococcus sp. UD-01 TaxID=3373911 RepID=UPI003834D9AA
METIKAVFSDQNITWVSVDLERPASVLEVKEKYRLDEEFIKYALDKNERARVEYDPLTETLLVVYNLPLQEKEDNYFVTSPVTFMIQKNHFFTFTSATTNYLESMIEKIISNDPDLSQFSLLFETIFAISDRFIPLIEEVNDERNRLNKDIKQKVSNKKLLALSDLSVGLVYLSTAIRQNSVLLASLKALKFYRNLTAEEKEQFEDAIIEANQAVAMIQLASDVLKQLSDTYNNLLNNNLNDTMKVLTLWSIILTVPAIITGYFGMNIAIPYIDGSDSWIKIIGLCVLLSGWIFLFIWRRIK